AVLRAAPPAPAGPVPARAGRRGAARGGAGLRPGDRRPGAQRHLSRRHAAEELRRLPPPSRRVLRLRRDPLGLRAGVPRLAAGDDLRGTGRGRALVPRRPAGRVSRTLRPVHGPARAAAGRAEIRPPRPVPAAVVARPAGAAAGRPVAGYTAVP